MGGVGSGDWHRYDKKSTVEESLVLAMRDFRKRIGRYYAGGFVWTWPAGHQRSIGYVITPDDPPTITLQYRWADREDVRIPIRLEATPTNFNGQRWWFECPLIIGGVACRRRAGKLYLPPGARYFGCRVCHDLSYRSSQEAHQAERGTGTIEWLQRRLDALLARLP